MIYPSYSNLWILFLFPIQLLLDSVLERFQSVHHFFFVLCKLLSEGLQSGRSDDNSNLKFSSEGGFLRQPTFNSVTTDIDGNSSKFGSTHLKKFSYFLSEVAWPCFCVCLSEGKAFIDHKISQVQLSIFLNTEQFTFVKRIQTHVDMSVYVWKWWIYHNSNLCIAVPLKLVV